jgi:uncharacterized NAD(P)/FAD-binding protein YdhS
MAFMSDTTDGWGEAEYAALGRITISFAELDHQAGFLFAGFIRPRDVAVIVTAGAELRWTLEKLAVIATEALEYPQARQARLNWVKASLTLADRRNQLIHSHYLRQAGEQSLTRLKATTRGARWRGQSEPVGLADLTETAGLLAEGLTAAGLIVEHLASCPEWEDPAVPPA